MPTADSHAGSWASPFSTTVSRAWHCVKCSTASFTANRLRNRMNNSCGLGALFPARVDLDRGALKLGLSPNDVLVSPKAIGIASLSQLSVRSMYVRTRSNASQKEIVCESLNRLV